MTKPNLRPCYYFVVAGGQFRCHADKKDEFNCPKKNGKKFVPSVKCLFAYKKRLDLGVLFG